MFTDAYTAKQVVDELRRLGYRLFIGEDGVVHGKGPRVTLETRAVIERLQTLNEDVAALLRAEMERMEYVEIPVEKALELGQQIKDGSLALEGMVHYHRSTDLVDMTVRKVEA